MNTQPLPELVAKAQEVLETIRQHPQYQKLNMDCDVTLGDVNQFFNTLQQTTASNVDTTPEEFFQ
ncbi:hypothetical protein H6G33_37260 [Calothrix sp. FACHB-1219]|uniref:hypothetical protein n=1 Tax=unclassified Calothrix TaxID=2619626 RepID=UPI001684649C|nr:MULTISPECIES: hypothetical protein [unclassified Calothrix]MBD2208006.1 hypothetical protein [Calothrix sp. FACHB-168]MBD2222577.1 hypothetical protein [Calothrix sp. FACHB-1219]